MMRNKYDRGFSLVEVLVTLLVVGVGIAAVARLQGVSAKEGLLAKQRVEAAALLEKKIAELRADPAGAVDGSDVVRTNSMVYSRNWTVSPSTTSPNEFIVSTTATWADLGITAERDRNPNAASHPNGGGNPHALPTHASQTAQDIQAAHAEKAAHGTEGGIVTPNTTLAVQAVIRRTTHAVASTVSVGCAQKKKGWGEHKHESEKGEHNRWNGACGNYSGKGGHDD